jgi:toxin-antitoxin system PIN domain toxin
LRKTSNVQSGVDLPDVNVWFALGFPDHPRHACAVRYWQEEAAPRQAFCRVTNLGLVRLYTNRTAMLEAPMTVPEAWTAYQKLRAAPGVQWADEPPECDALLGRWAVSGDFTPRLWTDAYLAAFTVAAGFRLVSMDGDFDRFKGLDFLHLEP